jgi:hypothetical protein
VVSVRQRLKEEPVDPHVTRRTLLAGAGAAAAAATIGTLATTASAQGDPSDPLQGGSAALQQEAGDLLPAALTPGLVYVPMDMSSFFPIDTSTVVRSVSTSGVTVTPSNVILTDIPVPQGGVLKEVILAYRAPAAPAMEVAMFKTPLASGTVMVQPFTPVPTGAGILSATFPFNETADQTTYLLDVQINPTHVVIDVQGVLE